MSAVFFKSLYSFLNFKLFKKSVLGKIFRKSSPHLASQGIIINFQRLPENVCVFVIQGVPRNMTVGINSLECLLP